MVNTIGNPMSWVARAFGQGTSYIGDGAQEVGGQESDLIEIRALEVEDLRIALRKGVDDFMAMRTDVMFIVVVYPIIGVLLTWFALNRALLPLLFPLVAGFALLGPLVAVGLYEMSRRREGGKDAGWSDAFGVMTSPSFVPIVVMGGYLTGIFIVWMFIALALFNLTVGPEAPLSIAAFLTDIFTTGAGWVMLIVGMMIGFCFAAVVLAISIVSFPILLDRHVGVPKAVVTSVRLTRANPRVVAIWGLIVAVSLAIGIGTLFIGLIFVLPILGHATWHLYRQAVAGPENGTGG